MLLQKIIPISEFTRGEGIYGERIPEIGEDIDVTDDDELNDSSQKPMILSNGFGNVGKSGQHPEQWRTNYSGSSSLSSFSYSPRSNNSSVSSHGRKMPRNNRQQQQNGSLKSSDAVRLDNSMDSISAPTIK